jgi:hypothetical protein
MGIGVLDMLVIIIAAVLGAAVGALTTASLKWGRSALVVLRARIQRDQPHAAWRARLDAAAIGVGGR